MNSWQILHGDVREQLRTLPDGCVQTCVTSPPYWGLRDYGHAGQIGLEMTSSDFVDTLSDVFLEVRRVLANDGTLWLNLGDSYAADDKWGGSTGGKHVAALHGATGIGRARRRTGLKPKDLCGIPWRVAFALQADGWYLRSDIIWSKPNPMPESVTDRPTKAHEYIFLLSKSPRYYYDADAVREVTGNESTPEDYEALKSERWSGPSGGDADARRVYAGSYKTNNPANGTKSTTHPLGRNKRSVWHVATQPFTDWTRTVRRVPVAPGDADGDTKRTTSPNCPVHGDRSALVASALYGERADDALSRIAHSDDDPGPSPLAGCVPIDQRREADSSAGSSDSRPLACALAASSRSTRNRRTGRDPVTSEPCSVSAEIQTRTLGTSESRGTSEPCDRTPENRSGQAASGAHLSAQTIDCIARTVSSADSCSCELYKEITEEMSHFATYPEKLIEPCILAGSRPGDTVLDPFTGSGTTGAVALRHGRNFIGCELNANYIALARKRLNAVAPLFASEATA